MFRGSCEAIDQAHGASATASIRCVEIHPIEGIEEVSPELNPHSFGHREVLLNAQIDIRKTGAADRTLSRTVSELLRPCRRSRGVIKPLIADVFAAGRIERCLPAEYPSRACAAIRTLAAGIHVVGRAARIVQCDRESSVYRDDRVDRPSAGNLVDYAARVATPLLAAAKGISYTA